MQIIANLTRRMQDPREQPMDPNFEMSPREIAGALRDHAQQAIATLRLDRGLMAIRTATEDNYRRVEGLECLALLVQREGLQVVQGWLQTIAAGEGL